MKLAATIVAASLVCPYGGAGLQAGSSRADLKVGPSVRTAQQASDALASFDEVWQTIADTFYDPAFGGLDWNAVRAELRPKAVAAASADDIRGVITEMLARLKRSHFVVLSASAAGRDGPIGPATVPIEVRATAEGVMITRLGLNPAAGAGLAPGQILVAIDGTSTAGWRVGGDLSAADARQRAFALWRQAYRALHGGFGSQAVLIVRDPAGAERQVTIARAPESGELVTLGNLPPLPVRTEVRELTSPGRHRVGFIGFNIWMTPIDAPIAAAVDRFRSADGMILDLRGNPGGLAAMMSGISGHFLADGDALLGRMQTRQAALEFRPNPRLSTAAGRRVVPFAGPLAILVDELTASTSECFAGALQSLGRARVFGRQTMGQALPALTKRLSDGDVLMYAVGNFVTSSGRSLEGEGVLPDERVARSAAALAKGQDPDVEAALRWLDGQKR